MIAMTSIPLLVRAAEQFKIEKLATLLAWPGYIWMGFLFIFCSILFFIDLAKIIYKLIIRRFIDKLPTYTSSINSCMFALVLAICASIYAFIEAGHIRADHVTITSSKLPTSISRIRIVQISDLHIGLLLQKGRLLRILEKVKEAKPDILVSTGDLVDGKLNRDDAISDLNPLAALLETVPTPFGKYAIIGNHEVYAGLPQAIAFSRAAGFTLLRNQAVELSNGLTISGVDDLAIKPKQLYNPNIEIALLNSIPKKSFNLLLKHRPDILPESDGHFDLQLSGHVHGGQIFPFNFLVKLKHAIPCGTTTTPAGSLIHVSRGTGTWGPPMRLFVPPEVTIIDIFSSDRR
jgi:predicted MPP superfamily phosphohydrolase